MKKIALSAIILVFFLFVTVALAEPNFYGTINEEKTSTSSGDSAKFMLSIYNNQSFTDTFYLLPSDVSWILGTYPSYFYFNGIEIGPKQSKEFRILVSPTKEVSLGRKDVGLKISSKKTNETEVKILKINVLEKQVHYLPDISAELITPNLIDPRKKASVQIVLKNNNPLNLGEVEVALKGKLVSKEVKAEISPNENKSIVFTVEFDKATAPGEDTWVATVKKDGEILAIDSQKIEVIGYAEPFKRNITVEKSFFKETTNIILENDVNIPKEQKIKYPLTLFERLFTYSTPKSDYIGKEKGNLIWTVLLKANEKTEIVVTINFRPLFYFAILFVLALIIYFKTRSPFIIRKDIKDVVEKESGISEFKVVVKVRNRSKKDIKDVKLIERIPHVMRIIKKDVKTIQPGRTYRYRQGTVLEWSFPEIESKEERVIMYRIKSNLIITGELRLKPSIIKFKNRKTFSNKAKVYTA